MFSRMERADRLRILATALLPPVILLALLISTASSRILTVPDPFPTIQAGLDSATVGDTVLVDPGVYYENLTWPATASVKLFANEMPPPLGVIIDGGFTVGPVITVAVPVDSTTEIRGFVIRNGMADYGAGVYCVGVPSVSAATIRANHFEDNSATAFGGAICCEASSPLILGNTFSGNSAAYGAAIALVDGSAAVVKDNTLTGNLGAGVYVASGSPAIQRNEVAANTIGVSVIGAATPTIGFNDIHDNLQDGIYVELGAPIIERNQIKFNHGRGIGGCTHTSTIRYNNICCNQQGGFYT